MHYVYMILIGFAVGVLARLVTPGRDQFGFILTVALGIAGSLLADYVGHAANWYQPGEPVGFIGSLIGAVILLAIVHVVRRKS